MAQVMHAERATVLVLSGEGCLVLHGSAEVKHNSDHVEPVLGGAGGMALDYVYRGRPRTVVKLTHGGPGAGLGLIGQMAVSALQDDLSGAQALADHLVNDLQRRAARPDVPSYDELRRLLAERDDECCRLRGRVERLERDIDDMLAGNPVEDWAAEE